MNDCDDSRDYLGDGLLLVTVVLLALKLGGVIAMPWKWALLPIWGPLALIIILGGIMWIWERR